MSDKILKDFSKFIKEELNKKDIKFITPKYVPRKRSGSSYNKKHKGRGCRRKVTGRSR